MLNAEMLAAAAGGGGNFFGDGSNGSYSTNSNDNWGVPSAIRSVRSISKKITAAACCGC